LCLIYVHNVHNVRQVRRAASRLLWPDCSSDEVYVPPVFLTLLKLHGHWITEDIPAGPNRSPVSLSCSAEPVFMTADWTPGDPFCASGIVSRVGRLAPGKCLENATMREINKHRPLRQRRLSHCVSACVCSNNVNPASRFAMPDKSGFGRLTMATLGTKLFGAVSHLQHCPIKLKRLSGVRRDKARRSPASIVSFSKPLELFHRERLPVVQQSF